VRKIVNVLSGSLQMAVKDGRLPANPAHGLNLLKVGKPAKRYLNHEQVRDLADALDSLGKGMYRGELNGYGLLVKILAYCGLRWGEASGLRVKDIDFKRGRLEVQHTIVEVDGVQLDSPPKGYEARFIPVPASLLAELKAEVIGQDGLTPHEIRHTAASLAISASANVKAVQRMLGQASAAVTLDVYSDLFDSDLDTISAALDEQILRTDVSKTSPRGRRALRQARGPSV